MLGGIALIGAVIFGMNYNFPYTDVGNQVFRTVPIVSQVRGRVQSVPVKPNQMLRKGDVLFTSTRRRSRRKWTICRRR